MIRIVFILASQCWHPESLTPFYQRFLFTVERLTNFQILVHNQEQFTEQSTVTQDMKCSTKFRDSFSTGQRLKIPCGGEINGRYVTILQDPPEPLEFCEVQVYGYSFRGNMVLYFSVISSGLNELECYPMEHTGGFHRGKTSTTEFTKQLTKYQVSLRMNSVF